MVNSLTLAKSFAEKAKTFHAKIAVLGDICLDRYTFIDTRISEISVETGLPTQSVKKEEYKLGAAGNVAVNLQKLGCHVDIYGVIGNDWNGKILLSLFDKQRINHDGIIMQKRDWQSHVYSKTIRQKEELNRLDYGNFNKPYYETIDRLISVFTSKMPTYDAIIINEQVLSGLHCTYLVTKLQKIIDGTDDKLFFVDTRNYIGSYKNVIYKLNKSEILSYTNENSIREAGKKLSSFSGKPVVITCGKEGAISISENEFNIAFGIDFDKPIDTVGAGDAFIAALASSTALGFSLDNATAIANFSASVSCLTLFGTGHPTPDEIIKVSENPQWRYNGWKIQEISEKKYVEDTDIEIIENFSSKLAIPDIAIFDHDGTISVLRQGWEKVMKNTLLLAISFYISRNPEEKEKIEDKIDQLIDTTTGIQTIIQMHMFTEMIKKEKLLPEPLIKTPAEYKAIYINNLKANMKSKLSAIKKGILSPEDLTMKDAIKFLRYLSNNGTILYLASGTDKDDVIEEANILGYGNLFGDNIFGSIDDISKDPKAAAIEAIIKTLPEEKRTHEKCIIFGDGPVEMREARKNGFGAIGILSDEKQRYGINDKKRKRLILAGAELLIPDFSEINKIFDMRRYDYV